MSDVINTRTVIVGRVTLTICQQADYDGYSYASGYLGKYSDYRQPQHSGEYLIHRASQRVLDCAGLWRDSRGRITKDPRNDWSERRWEYGYVWNDNGHEGIKYPLQHAARLEALERGDWYYLGIIATVTLDGAEIGQGSLWGVESDSGDAYLAQTGREVTREALQEARKWMQRNGLSNKAPRGWRVAG